MNTLINLNTLIDQGKLSSNYLRPWQRYIATFMGYFLLLQICLPTVAIAATMLTNEQFSSLLNSPVYKSTGKTSGNFYARPNYLQVDTQSGSNIASFYKSLSPTKSVLPETTLVIGDDFVQQRLIRGQISMVLGRTLIDPSKLLLGSEAKKAYELTQNDSLFAAGVQFGLSKAKAFGTPLTAQDTVVNDMIWPEKRSIYGADVIIPVVYLSQATLNTKPVGHQINLGLSTIFNNIEVNKGLVVSASGNENYTTVISAINNIVNSGSLSGAGNLNLVAGNTLANLSGKIQATNNLDISVVKGNVINKTQLIPYQSKDGSGTRFGTIATIDSLNGNIKITSGGSIAYEGGTSTSFYGSLTFNANGNIILAPATITSESTTQDGGWTVNKTSFELMQSKLTANQMLTLMAGGTISITASELYSTQGGIQLLAKHGIYVADELGYFQSNRTDKLGRTTGTGSDFESFAVRSVLSAGKGVLLATDSGDITLKGAKITAGEGTQVKAINGKVHLLVTKENSQHYLDTVKKGTWTIKTVHEEYLQDTGIPNAIVGGLAVEALAGIDIEYTGIDIKANPNLTLNDQINEYRKIPDLKWMADIYDDKDGKYKTQVNWQEVERIYKHISEHNTNLSPAAMAIIAICVAVAMGPMGANLLSGISTSVTTLTGSAVVGAAASAGALTLATAAAQNLAAGKNLDETLKAITSDDALKNLAISMVTAGALNGLDVGNMELFHDALIGSALDFANQSYQAVVNSVVTAGISVTINGGNSEDYRKAFTQSLATNAVNTIGQSLTNKITNSTTLNEASKYIAHAAMGCLTAGLTNKLSDADFKDACPSGAGGAVIAQGVADIVASKTNELTTLVSDVGLTNNASKMAPILSFLGENGVDISKLLAGFTAVALGGDVNAAANSASSVAQSNRDAFLKAALLGNLVVQYGMSNCVNKSLAVCTSDSVRDGTRETLKAQGKTSQQIEAAIATLDAKHFFDIFGRFNPAFINGGATLDDMSVRLYNEAKQSGSSNNSESPFILVEDVQKTIFQETIVDFGVAAGEVVEKGESVVSDAIGAALNNPLGQPIKSALSWVAGKGKELSNKYEIVQDLNDVNDELSKLYGVGSFSYLYDHDYLAVKENVKDPGVAYKDEASFVKGISWIGNTLTGFGVAKLGSVISVKRYIQPGDRSFRINLSKELDRLGAEGHALERHGGSVTNDQLRVRAQTGIGPDGSSTIRDGEIVIPKTSTAFNSDELVVNTDVMIRNNYLDQAIALSKSGADQVTIEGVEIGSIVGRGYDRISSIPGVEGPLQFYNDLSRVTAVYRYDAITHIWKTITIYPVK
jgi:filamentous hemagglutinin